MPLPPIYVSTVGAVELPDRFGAINENNHDDPDALKKSKTHATSQHHTACRKRFVSETFCGMAHLVRVIRIHENQEVLAREHVCRGVIRDDLADPRLGVRRAARNGIRAGVLDNRAELVGAVRAHKVDDDAVLILPLLAAPTLTLHRRERDERPNNVHDTDDRKDKRSEHERTTHHDVSQLIRIVPLSCRVEATGEGRRAASCSDRTRYASDR